MIRVGRGASAVAVLALVLSLVVALLVRADAGQAGVATHLEITAASSSIVTGTVLQLEIRAKDDGGAVDTTYTGDKTLTFSGINPGTNPVNPPTVKDKNGIIQNVGDPTVITFTNGVATAGGELAAYLAEAAVIAATDGSITTSSGAGGGTFALTVTADVASRLHIAGSTSQFAGTAQQLTITAIDGYGNTDSAYTGNKVLRFRHGIASSGPSDFGGAHATVTNRNGTAIQFSGGDNVTPVAPDNDVEITFTNGISTAGGLLTLVKAETVDVSVQEVGASLSAEAGDWLTVTVSGTHLVITGSASQTAGATQQLTITAKDQSNATDTSYTGDHTLVFSGASSSSAPVTAPTVTDKDGDEIDFGTGTTITFASGVATAGGLLKLTKAESATIAAAESGGPSAAGADRLGVTVSAGALAKFALVLATPQTSATAFTGTNTLTAQDALGNTVTDFDASADPVTIAAVAPLATLGSISGLHGIGGDQLDLEADFSSGVADLTALGLTYTGTAATGTFTATSLVTSKTGTSGSVVVSAPAVPASFAITAGAGTLAAGGTLSITVTAKTGSGSTLTGYTGSHVLQFAGLASSPGPVTAPTVTGTGSAIALGSDTTLSFTAGVATATLRAYRAEAAALGAGSTGEGVSVPAGGSGDRLSLVVSPAAASSFAFSLASPQTSGAAFTGTNILTAKDAYGNVATAFSAATANVTLTSSAGTVGGIHGGAVLNLAGDFASGVANLTALGLTLTGSAGNVTLAASASGGAVTGSSSGIQLDAATPPTPTCLLGTYLLNGSCVAAPAGSYADATGLHPCPANTFSTVSGALSCSPCPTGSTAAAGATACTFSPQSVSTPLPVPTVSSVTTTSAVIAWLATPPGFTPSAQVPAPTGYSLQLTASATPAPSQWTVVYSGTSLASTITNLPAGTTFRVRVAMLNPGGTSPYSAVAAFTTISLAPAAPTGVTVPDVQTTTATVSWKAPATGTSPSTYVVRFKKAAASAWDDGCQVTSTSCTVGPLDDGVDYEVQVASVAGGQTSDYTDSKAFKTPLAAGAAVSNFKVVHAAGGTFTATWDPPAGAAGSTYTYTLVYSTSGDATQYDLPVTTTDTRWSDTNEVPETPGSTITFMVTSKDAAGRTGTATATYVVPRAAPILASAAASPFGSDGAVATLTLGVVDVPSTAVINGVTLRTGSGSTAVDTPCTSPTRDGSVVTCSFSTSGIVVGSTAVSLTADDLKSASLSLTGTLFLPPFGVKSATFDNGTLTITGTGFTSDSTVALDGSFSPSCTGPVVATGGTSITCDLSSQPLSGSYTVTVTRASRSGEATFVVTTPTGVVSPSSVVAGQSAIFTITGTGFGRKAPAELDVTLSPQVHNFAVLAESVTCAATWVSSTEIVCSVEAAKLKQFTYTVEVQGLPNSVVPGRPGTTLDFGEVTVSAPTTTCLSGTAMNAAGNCVSSTALSFQISLTYDLSTTKKSDVQLTLCKDVVAALNISNDRCTIASLTAAHRRGLRAAVPAQVTVLGLVSVRPTGSAAGGRTPTVVLRSPRIRPGDGAYLWTVFGLRPVAAASAAGRISVPVTASSTIVVLRLPARGAGYGAVAVDGSVQRLGVAAGTAFFPPAGGARRVVAASSARDGSGGATVSASGQVWTYGSVKGAGSLTPAAAKAGATAIAVVPGGGYLVATRDGKLHAFGKAAWFGDLRFRPKGAPIVAILPNATGRGYVLVRSNGEVRGFGAAPALPRFAPTGGWPVTGAALTRDGAGLLVVDAVGHVHALGSARTYGDLARKRIIGSVVGIAPSVAGKGYTLVASTGRAYRFGDAREWKPQGAPAAAPVVAVVS